MPMDTAAPTGFAPARRLTPEQDEMLRGLHEECARHLSRRLSGALHALVEVGLEDITQPGYAEYAAGLEALGYLATVTIAPHHLTAVLDLDLVVATAMIEAMLGGAGAGERRDLTPVEEHLLEPVLSAALQEVEKIWEPATQLRFGLERRQPMKYAARLLPAHERLLLVTFAVQFAGTTGRLRLGVPALGATLLLRQSGQGWAPPRQAVSPPLRERLKQRLGEAQFGLELVLPPTRIPIQRFLALAEGQVLALRQPAESPARLRAAGRTLFEATPVRQAQRRGALIQKRLELSSPLPPEGMTQP